MAARGEVPAYGYSQEKIGFVIPLNPDGTVQFGDQIVVRHDPGEAFGGALEFAMQPRRIGREFAFSTDLKSSGESRRLQRGLGRRAQEDGTSIVARQFV